MNSKKRRKGKRDTLKGIAGPEVTGPVFPSIAVLVLRSEFVGFETIFSGFRWFLSTDIKDQEIALSRTNMSALVGHRAKMYFWAPLND
jgi:hypothetical protein